MLTAASRYINAIECIAATARFTCARGIFYPQSPHTQQKRQPQGSRASLAAWLGVLAALLALPSFSQTSQPSTAPVLRIEAGMHTASIQRIATDSQGRYAVTASDDKTARVWDVATGRLLSTLRVPLDADDEGKLYAAALSPNGQTVAVAGWTGDEWSRQVQIYLFDRSSGRLTQRLGGMPNAIFHLAFSLDGQWLAASLGGKNGVRAFNLATGAAALADSDYGANSHGAHFGPGNQLATTSYDGQIRLYSLAGGRLAKLAQVPAPGGKQPFGIAFSATGLLAVGYRDSTRVDVLDGQTLAVRHTPSSAGVSNGDLSSVAWSADGRSLYAGGRWQQNGQHPVRRWGEQGRGNPVDIASVGDTIFSLQTLPTGGVLLGGGEPAWGVVDAADRWQAKSQGVLADLRGSRGDAGYALSADGKTVQFGYEPLVKLPHRFALTSRSLLPGKDSQLLLPRTQGLDIKD